MQPSPASASAIFRDRDGMEIAVRALVERGVRPQRIFVSHGSTIEPVQTERGSALLLGVAIGIASGAAMMLVWIYWLSSLGALPLGIVVHKTVYSAMTGGFVGGLLSVLALVEHRLFRAAALGDDGDFIVTVKPPSESEAREICALMALRGGELVAAPATGDAPYRTTGWSRAVRSA